MSEPNRLPPEVRYSRDPWFHTLVDLIYQHLERGRLRSDFTPTEIREAAILACTLHEERHPRALIIPASTTARGEDF